MRPIPKSRHLVAALLLAGVASIYGYIALHDERLSDAMIHAATAAARAHDDSAMRCDTIFGQDNLWRLNRPLPQYLLSAVLARTSYQDLTFPFRASAGIVSLIYLCGMYALLYAQCRSWSVAVFVAVLSSNIVSALGESYWGVGSLASAAPQGLFIAFAPWLVLAFLRFEHTRGMPAVFLAIGLTGNIYLVGAANLTIVLLMAHLARQRLSRKSLMVVGICLLCALAGMSATLYHHASVRLAVASAATGAAQAVSARDALAALRLARLGILPADIPAALLSWLISVAILCVPATVAIIKIGRFRTQNAPFWTLMALSALLVGLGLHLLSLLIGRVFDTAPPAIDFIQAASFAMLPMYVFFASALTSLFRIVASQRRLLQWACVAIMAIWIVPSDNLRPVRWKLFDLATMWRDDADKPPNVRRHRRHRRRSHEMAEIARWAKANTSTSAVFLTGDIEFRMRSGRGIAASAADVRYIYHITPQWLTRWRLRVQEQDALLEGRPDAAGVQQLTKKWNQQGLFKDAKQWYLIISAAGEVGEGLQEITSSAWGKSFRLFKLP